MTTPRTYTQAEMDRVLADLNEAIRFQITMKVQHESDLAAAKSESESRRQRIVQLYVMLTAKDAALAAAQEAIRKQGQSALMGMDAAKAIASHNLESAKALNAQSNPAALDEARALNERLTNELEAAQEARQAAEEKYRLASDSVALWKERAQAAESKQTALEVTVRELTGSMERAEARAEQNEKDAERYRYLRRRDKDEVFNNDGVKAGVWIDCTSEMGELQLLTGEDADAAIDAAIAGEPS